MEIQIMWIFDGFFDGIFHFFIFFTKIERKLDTFLLSCETCLFFLVLCVISDSYVSANIVCYQMFVVNLFRIAAIHEEKFVKHGF